MADAGNASSTIEVANFATRPATSAPRRQIGSAPSSDWPMLDKEREVVGEKQSAQFEQEAHGARQPNGDMRDQRVAAANAEAVERGERCQGQGGGHWSTPT